MPLRPGPPPPTLLAELQEVAARADDFSHAVVGANYLPDGFPATAMVDLCQTLSALAVGTGEGCRVPLEYSRLRLPAVRREFVKLSGASVDDEGRPLVARGDHVDGCLGALIAAVSTALDEYRFLASSSAVDEIEISPTAAAHLRADVADVSSKISSTTTMLHEAGGEFSAIRRPESLRADTLSRTIADAEALSKLASVELGMRRIVVRWLKTLAVGITKIPTALRVVGGGIKVGSDIAQIALGRWSTFWSNFESFVLKEIGDTGEAIEAVADRLEKKSKIEQLSIPWRNVAEFRLWLRTHVAAQSDESIFGIEYQDVLNAIIGLTNDKPNNLARSFGHKTLIEVVRESEGVHVLRGLGGVICLTVGRPAAIERALAKNTDDITNFVLSLMDAGGPLRVDFMTKRIRARFRPLERLVAFDRAMTTRQLLQQSELFVPVDSIRGEVWSARSRQGTLPFIEPNQKL